MYEHFQTELHKIGFFIQPQKCETCSPFSLSPNFDIPSLFNTPLERIRVLRVSLDTSSFISSFIKKNLPEDVWHVDLFPRVGDV